MPGSTIHSATNIAKVDERLGLVFGYCIVCKEMVEGSDRLVEHFDTQGDHIPEDVMLKAATDFALISRESKDMHKGEACQTAVFTFPLTEDIAAALDIEVKKTGLLIAIKPTPEILEKYRSGEYTGFSIGGVAFETERLAA